MGLGAVLGGAALAMMVTGGGVAPAVPRLSPVAPGDPGSVLVFGAEGDNLLAYDAYAPGSPSQVVIHSKDAEHPDGMNINGQICFFPDGSRRFVAGEDTDQGEGRPQGWGIFQLAREHLGELSATEVGRLVPTFVTTQASTPENYGCGFLADGRIVTTDVGDQFPGQPATGQLIVWFGPFDTEQVPYCKIDTSIATAGGVYVDDQDRVYVASNRPDEVEGELPGVYRYAGAFPTGPDAAGGCGRTDATGAPLVDAGRVNKELFIPTDGHITTPSAIAPSAAGTLYVSSVFTGVIAEYTAEGAWVRNVLEPPGGLPIGQVAPGITPFGVGVDSLGTLYYADLGIVTVQPAPGAGSVGRIRFEGGTPQAPETMLDGLDFPEGIGVLETVPGPAAGGPNPPSPPDASTATRSLPPTGSRYAGAAAVLLLGGAWLTGRVVRRAGAGR